MVRTISPYSSPEDSLFFQPFVQKRGSSFESLLEKIDFSVACSEDQVFAGKIQVGSQVREFALHGLTVDLNQEFVAWAKGGLLSSTGVK